MDFELPPDDDPRRVAIRSWLADHPTPSGRELAEAGYVAPHLPRPWGLDADPIEQLVIDDELRAAAVRRPSNPIGIGWAGPTLVHAGTPGQQARYLPGLLSGEEIWCQLFSEPGAGSDLANLGTRAVQDGDEWVVNGQKIWTSLAQFSRYGILIARTDPDVAKHRGITYFVCPMDLPGIEVRPIIEMTGGHTFNEVFLTDVRLPADSVVGEVGRGWELAKVTLGNERVSLSSGGALWGMGPSGADLLDLVRAHGGAPDPLLRQRLARLHTTEQILRLVRLRTVSARIRGEQPGPEASIRKVMADEHGQETMAVAKDLAGPGGMLADNGPLGTAVGPWHHGYLFAPALTIGGGTGDVQRNILAERVLGLPHDLDAEAGRTWAESRRAG
ncbi:MAG TPA: acyl-CoA dehydrogenase family protein [Aquihabitans sp.]|jgi:alkylation response protein AidB-like acyl-CoA dehydrogenase|nr:acyl-CoA dehydrogenase family protein [Aquihabitans sp.]